jgi:hypothetical protein
LLCPKVSEKQQNNNNKNKDFFIFKISDLVLSNSNKNCKDFGSKIAIKQYIP